jgi:putative transposase
MRSGPTWTEFLRTQASSTLARAFFSFDTVLLRRLNVLFFIEIGTRRAYVTGVTCQPIGSWLVQQVRDRDAKFTSSFDEYFNTEGIRIIRTPAKAPRANAFAEYFVGTVRRECLDRMLIVGRWHLERVLAEYETHYNGHRRHRALAQQAPITPDTPPRVSDPLPAQLRQNDAVFGLILEYRLVASPGRMRSSAPTSSTSAPMRQCDPAAMGCQVPIPLRSERCSCQSRCWPRARRGRRRRQGTGHCSASALARR